MDKLQLKVINMISKNIYVYTHTRPHTVTFNEGSSNNNNNGKNKLTRFLKYKHFKHVYILIHSDDI